MGHQRRRTSAKIGRFLANTAAHTTVHIAVLSGFDRFPRNQFGHCLVINALMSDRSLFMACGPGGTCLGIAWN